MPKMKTKKGAAKRIKMNKNGKAKVKRSHLRHILTSKTTKSKRQSRTPMFVAESDMAHVVKMLPYG